MGLWRRLLLCTDGLTGMLDDEEIREIPSQRPNPQILCERLVARANETGGEDNITALVLMVSGRTDGTPSRRRRRRG